LGKIKYICIKLGGLLPINHRRIRGPTSDLTIAPVYAGTKRPVVRCHKLANSLTCLLGHKRDIERALLEQVKPAHLQLYPRKEETSAMANPLLSHLMHRVHLKPALLMSSPRRSREELQR
jgi:hypothetical protein